MKQGRLYFAFVGVVLVLAVVAGWQAFVSGGDEPARKPDLQEPNGTEIGYEGMSEKDLALIKGSALEWVEAYFATSVEKEQYIERICAASTEGLAQDLRAHFAEQVDWHVANDLFIEAKDRVEQGIEIDASIAKIEVQETAGIALYYADVIHMYPDKQMSYTYFLMLEFDGDTWKVSMVERWCE